MSNIMLLIGVLTTIASITMAITNLCLMKRVKKVENELAICKKYASHIAKQHNKAFRLSRDYKCYENVIQFKHETAKSLAMRLGRFVEY